MPSRLLASRARPEACHGSSRLMVEEELRLHLLGKGPHLAKLPQRQVTQLRLRACW